MSIDIPSHYLDGIKLGLTEIGDLNPKDAETAVEFCHRAQIFIDSTRPHMSFHHFADLNEKRSHAEETLKNIGALLRSGDQLAQIL